MEAANGNERRSTVVDNMPEYTAGVIRMSADDEWKAARASVMWL